MKRDPLPQSGSDSLLGMALAQSFMGMVYGAGADLIWEAGEIGSAVYEDRCDQKRTNGRGVFQLGVEKSLAGIFTRNSQGTVAEQERAAFRPSYAPQYALGF